MSQSSHMLPDIPCGWTTEEFVLGERTVRVTRPADPDQFLDDAEVLEANRRNDYMPYWSYLWPAAPPMAQLVARHAWPQETEALEIGCGIGLVGLGALLAGLQVTFSDYDEKSIRLAVFNAVQNGFSHARGLWLDWRRPLSRRFPVILGCEVIYEYGLHSLVLDVLDAMLAEGGQCWIGDPGRQYAPAFHACAIRRGYTVEIRDAHGRVLSRDGQPPNFQQGEFRLQILRRADAPGIDHSS